MQLHIQYITQTRTHAQSHYCVSATCWLPASFYCPHLIHRSGRRCRRRRRRPSPLHTLNAVNRVTARHARTRAFAAGAHCNSHMHARASLFCAFPSALQCAPFMRARSQLYICIRAQCCRQTRAFYSHWQCDDCNECACISKNDTQTKPKHPRSE